MSIEMKTEKMTETREQIMAKIQFFLPKLNDRQLKMVSAFIRGMVYPR